jgi:hypothetical protein
VRTIQSTKEKIGISIFHWTWYVHNISSTTFGRFCMAGNQSVHHYFITKLYVDRSPGGQTGYSGKIKQKSEQDKDAIN